MDTAKAFRVEKEIGGRMLSIETGKLAKQATASAMVQYSDTVVMVAATTAAPRAGLDFFPLTVDYRERTYAAGKFPGGFYKRESRPTDKEILTMRAVDRPIRPLFDPQFLDEVQIQCIVLSADQENDPDLVAINGASAALTLSGLPFNGPIAAVRVGRVNGELILNPTHKQLDESEFELLVAGRKEAVNMIEFQGNETPEDVVSEAVEFGHNAVIEICEMIQDLVSQCGKPVSWTAPPVDAELNEAVRSQAEEEMLTCRLIPGKKERSEAIDELKERVLDALSPEEGDTPPRFSRADVVAAFRGLEKKAARKLLREGKRPDGRPSDQVRPISCEVGVLPRTHGSALFARGETQGLVVVTLGTPGDQQIIDGLQDEYRRKFMLHYNFPPFSVGEVRPLRGPSRRDIGHGALAEKSLEAILPTPDQFPYTIRVVSDILDSNGSTSMATVCGGTLSLMDAGVPIQDPVAGISIGLITGENGQEDILLTDIVGEEDHFGDMDFKVAGTQRGITGIQLDLKISGISHDLTRRVLDRAREARMAILKEMLATISEPRAEISRYAPRLLTIKINPEKIGKVIGPGGKGIKKIQEQTGSKIDIEDDGTIYISSVDADNAERARLQVESVVEEVQVGRVYLGQVVSVKDFGAFVEVLPGQEGLCHISELADRFVENVTDEMNIGDEVKVKVIGIDDQGRIKLSRKAAASDES
jgi:polyribonucleotide nucleotidyltransferase